MEPGYAAAHEARSGNKKERVPTGPTLDTRSYEKVSTNIALFVLPGKVGEGIRGEFHHLRLFGARAGDKTGSPSQSRQRKTYALPSGANDVRNDQSVRRKRRYVARRPSRVALRP
jgi:hypothetical protein